MNRSRLSRICKRLTWDRPRTYCYVTVFILVSLNRILGRCGSDADAAYTQQDRSAISAVIGTKSARPRAVPAGYGAALASQGRILLCCAVYALA